MHKKYWIILIILLLTACASPPPQITQEPQATPTLVPTLSPSETATQTQEPTAEPLPGVEIIPIDQMAKQIPWLDAPAGRTPATLYFGFNVNTSPFNNLLVRQAFAAAVDREAIVQNALRLGWDNAVPATTLIPAEILGRRLYNEVGIAFDPERARELLAEAGYSDPSTFPTIKLSTNLRFESAAPGSYIQFTQALAQMREENLGVNIEIREFSDSGQYFAFLTENSNEVDIHRAGFSWTDQGKMDPHWVMEIFYSESQYADFNYSNYRNREYDSLIRKGFLTTDPATRQEIYIEAERLLVEDEAVIIPIFHWTLP